MVTRNLRRVSINAIARVFASQTVTQQSAAASHSDVGRVFVVVVAATDQSPRRVRQRDSRVERRTLLDCSSGRKIALEAVLVGDLKRGVARPIAQTSTRRRCRRTDGAASLEGVDWSDFVFGNRHDHVEVAAAATATVRRRRCCVC